MRADSLTYVVMDLFMQMVKAILLTIGDVIVNNWSTLITMIVVTLLIEALSNYIKACTL